MDNSFGPDSALHVPNDYQTYGGITRLWRWRSWRDSMCPACTLPLRSGTENGMPQRRFPRKIWRKPPLKEAWSCAWTIRPSPAFPYIWRREKRPFLRRRRSRGRTPKPGARRIPGSICFPRFCTERRRGGGRPHRPGGLPGGQNGREGYPAERTEAFDQRLLPP